MFRLITEAQAKSEYEKGKRERGGIDENKNMKYAIRKGGDTDGRNADLGERDGKGTVQNASIRIMGKGKEYLYRRDYSAIIGRKDRGYDRFTKATEGTALTAKDGAPLIVFHGTKRAYNQFKAQKGADKNFSSSAAFYYTDNPRVANDYAEFSRGKDEAGIIPVALVVRAPLQLDADVFKQNLEAQNALISDILAMNKYAGQAGFIDHAKIVCTGGRTGKQGL